TGSPVCQSDRAAVCCQCGQAFDGRNFPNLPEVWNSGGKCLPDWRPAFYRYPGRKLEKGADFNIGQSVGNGKEGVPCSKTQVGKTDIASVLCPKQSKIIDCSRTGRI